MSITVSKRSSITRIRLLILTAAAVAVWIGLPLALHTATSYADTTTTAAPLVAPLTGPAIGGVMPFGTGVYSTASVGTNTMTRTLRVEISSVNLPAGTALAVFHNAANIGSITVDPMRHGLLNLTTANGGTVPTVVAGDALSVR